MYVVNLFILYFHNDTVGDLTNLSLGFAFSDNERRRNGDEQF